MGPFLYPLSCANMGTDTDVDKELEELPQHQVGRPQMLGGHNASSKSTTN